MTQTKLDGKQIHVAARKVEGEIAGWLKSITVSPEWLPQIREQYYTQMYKIRHEDRSQKLTILRRRVASLREEEQRLARLYITSQMTEESYTNLRSQWSEKVRQAESDLAILEAEATQYLNDLDMALQLLSQVSTLFEQFDLKRRVTLLQILAKRIIVREDGEIIDHELHSPFTYLLNLVPGGSSGDSGSGSVNRRSF